MVWSKGGIREISCAQHSSLHGTDFSAQVLSPDSPPRTVYPVYPAGCRWYHPLQLHDLTVAHAFLYPEPLFRPLTLTLTFPGPTQMPPSVEWDLPWPPEDAFVSACICANLSPSLSLNFPICKMGPVMFSLQLCCESQCDVRCLLARALGLRYSFIDSSDFYWAPAVC